MIVAVLSLAVGLAVGSWFATRRAFSVFAPLLEGQALVSVHFKIEELVWHRTGKSAKALLFAEQQLDGAILALPQGREWTGLSREVRSALTTAKLYRQVFPFEQASAQAAAVLDQVGTESLDPATCSPAARYLLAQVPKG